MAILTHDDGLVARTPLDAEQAEAAGYVKCPTYKSQQGGNRGQPCQFYISPEAQSSLQQNGGYFTCPSCQQSNDLLHELPWHGVTDEEEIYRNEQRDQSRNNWHAGGGTRIGLTMDEQAQIGEDLVENLGEIPGYGPITWWHQGGSTAPSPLDGATAEWGIEVKTLGYDATHHRFVPGRPKEKIDKNDQASQLGKKGILGVLVLLDYRRSVADIFVKEYPLAEGGVKAFRSSQKGVERLVAEVPFRNPLMDPHSPSPSVNTGQDMPF